MHQQQAQAQQVYATGPATQPAPLHCQYSWNWGFEAIPCHCPAALDQSGRSTHPLLPTVQRRKHLLHLLARQILHHRHGYRQSPHLPLRTSRSTRPSTLKSLKKESFRICATWKPDWCRPGRTEIGIPGFPLPSRVYSYAKKQKVFFWHCVPHESLFLDAIERDFKREGSLYHMNMMMNHTRYLQKQVAMMQASAIQQQFSSANPSNAAVMHPAPQLMPNVSRSASFSEVRASAASL